jgi:hypothetical protein
MKYAEKHEGNVTTFTAVWRDSRQAIETGSGPFPTYFYNKLIKSIAAGWSRHRMSSSIYVVFKQKILVAKRL